MNVQRSLNIQYHDEVLLSKAPNPQLLPGRRSINGCPLLLVCVHGVCVFTVCVCSRCVCVHGVCVFTVCVCSRCVCVHGVCVQGVCSRCVCALGRVKCRARIPSMGHHTWLYVTLLSCFHFHTSLTYFENIYMHMHLYIYIIIFYSIYSIYT